MSGSGRPGRTRMRDEGEIDGLSIAQKPAWRARSWSTARPFPIDLRRARSGSEGVDPARRSLARHK